MAAICIFIGLALAVAGIIIAYATGERENKNTSNMPPPLPPRISTENPAIVVVELPTTDTIVFDIACDIASSLLS